MKTLCYWILLLGLVSCGLRSTPTPSAPTATATAIEEVVANVPTAPPSPVPSDTPTVPPQPTDTSEPTLTATPTMEPSPTPLPADFAVSAESIRYYPNPTLYEGDIVTFEIVPHVPDDAQPYLLPIELYVDGELLQADHYFASNFSEQRLYRYQWAWDTTDLVGDHAITVVIDPDDEYTEFDEDETNNRATTIVSVLAAEELPFSMLDMGWEWSEGAYTYLYAIRGTAAHRDLPELTALADEAVLAAAESLGVQLPSNIKLDVYLIDRVIGQGGYVSGYLTYVISYLDRHYASNNLYQVLLHETVHVLDNQYITPDGGSGFMGEGLAVWISGGHYKVEDLARRTAALVPTGLYIPFEQLMDNFYPSQHEIGYLEAGAFLQYLDERYGYAEVEDFLVTAGNVDDSVYAAVDAATQAHFDIPLDELEEQWLEHLANLSPDPDTDWEADVLTTIRAFDVMRDYQTAYDLTANYLYGWLPPAQEALRLDSTAEFSRRPENPENIALEALLVGAQNALQAGDYVLANQLLDEVEAVLDSGSFADTLAQDYLEIVQVSAENGFEPQQITINDDTATVLAHTLTPAGEDHPATQFTLNFSWSDGNWTFLR